jgi:hypothetical protein
MFIASAFVRALRRLRIWIKRRAGRQLHVTRHSKLLGHHHHVL